MGCRTRQSTQPQPWGAAGPWGCVRLLRGGLLTPLPWGSAQLQALTSSALAPGLGKAHLPSSLQSQHRSSARRPLLACWKEQGVSAPRTHHLYHPACWGTQGMWRCSLQVSSPCLCFLACSQWSTTVLHWKTRGDEPSPSQRPLVHLTDGCSSDSLCLLHIKSEGGSSSKSIEEVN